MQQREKTKTKIFKAFCRIWERISLNASSKHKNGDDPSGKVL